MSLVDDLKKQASDTIDALDKKKSEALKKAGELKEEYERNQRIKKSDSLYQKEIASSEKFVGSFRNR